MSENKNDMSFADMIARVNRHNMQAVADAHNNLLKRVEVLEQEIKAESKTVSWKDFEDFLDDNAEDFDSIGERFDALEERLKVIEEKIEGYVFE